MPPKRFPKREPPCRRPPAVAVGGQNNESDVAGPSTILDEQNQNYDEELAWCIHQLKLSLSGKKLLSLKQKNDIKRDVASLEDPMESVVKKRCIMKMSLGNYRQLMGIEKRKVSLELRNSAINPAASTQTGQFMRKSHLVSEETNSNSVFFRPSDNSFRFNFNCDNQKE